MLSDSLPYVGGAFGHTSSAPPTFMNFLRLCAKQSLQSFINTVHFVKPLSNFVQYKAAMENLSAVLSIRNTL